MNPEQLWETTLDTNARSLLQVKVQGGRRGRRHLRQADGRRGRAAPRIHSGECAHGKRGCVSGVAIAARSTEMVDIVGQRSHARFDELLQVVKSLVAGLLQRIQLGLERFKSALIASGVSDMSSHISQGLPPAGGAPEATRRLRFRFHPVYVNLDPGRRDPGRLLRVGWGSRRDRLAYDSRPQPAGASKEERCDAAPLNRSRMLEKLYQIPFASIRRVVGCAISPGHGGAIGRPRRRFCARGRPLTFIIARCRDRDATQTSAACAKSPFDAVPAASVSQRQFCTPYVFGPHRNPV